MIEGQIENAADSMLYLEENTLDGIQVVDSVLLKADGAFRFNAVAPADCPGFYMLRLGSERICFAVDSTETVSVKASLPNLARDYSIEGNVSSQKMKEIALMQQDLQWKIVELEENEDMYPGDIADSIDCVLSAYKERMKRDYIFSDPASAYAYYAVCQSINDLRGPFMLFNPLNDREDVKAYAAVATAWDCYYPDAPRTIQLCNAAIRGLDNTEQPKKTATDGPKVTEIGIIDVELPDINSSLHKLTDLKGKVVLLDFTVFAAKESPQRTRLLRTLYEKYNKQGLEIYQVSVDDDIHFWKTSVEHLPWISVHETDGHAVSSYGVESLPTFFLIDRNNEIVLRSDFMEGTLENNIRKLL
ncbi:MAG: AhpC/TSA family protein [Bacteroidaceae bacterium]|nr:AhpC/TSA family protein [Bacteroidaceae bacterium]